MDISKLSGAGPGDPELISIRGRRMLENADLILYAGSLVPKELTLCSQERIDDSQFCRHEPGRTIRPYKKVL